MISHSGLICVNLYLFIDVRQQRIYTKSATLNRFWRKKNSMLKKVVIVQCEIGKQLSLDENLLIFKQRPEFVILPEYFNVNPLHRDTQRNFAEAHEWLKYCTVLSERLETTLIAGTAVESDGQKFYNTCSVFHKGEFLSSYSKTHPTVNERKNQITPSSGHVIIPIRDINISILICADVLEPDNFRQLRPLNPDLIFIPTTSPEKPHETTKDKFARDEQIFVTGARDSGAYCIKCCAVGTLWGGRLQGRSSVSAPWGVIRRINPIDENKTRILSIVLDIDELREFREKQDLQNQNK